MLRLFVAVDPPDTIKRQLLLLNRSISGARWQNLEQIHITISFIGEVSNSQLPPIKDALASIKAEPIELSINSVDYFGSNRQPRTLYAKVVPNPELRKLSKQINDALSEIDLKIEKRKFKPHITLARLKQTSYQFVGEFIQQEALFKTESFWLDEFHLFSSKLKPEGAQYSIEGSFALDYTN